MNKQLNILILGVIPPPVGGISIHVKRFINNIQGNSSINCILFDYKKKRFYKNSDEKISLSRGLFFILKAEIIHIHISSPLKLLIGFFFKYFLFKKLIYTHHNSLIKNFTLHNLLFRICTKIILVNKEKISPQLLLKYNSKISEIPAFLPPNAIDEIPAKWKEKIPTGVKIISSNFYAFSTINGKDVYGVDLILEAALKLKKITNEPFCLLLVDPQGQYKNVINPYLNLLPIVHITEVVDFNAIIKISTLVIRATRTDGDSITIRESLFFQKTIIASDCVKRPSGTVLFANENTEDLCIKISENLVPKETINSTRSTKNYLNDILEIYQTI